MKFHFWRLALHLARLITACSLALSALAVRAPQPALADGFDLTGPTGSGRFGAYVFSLPNGNLVVTDPEYSSETVTNIGAVYLYNGATRELISKMTGTTANDKVGSGGVRILEDGNFVVSSPRWNNGAVALAGAATWCSAAGGCPATVSPSNSLVGSHTNDRVSNGWTDPEKTTTIQDGKDITALPGGAYLVRSFRWHGERGALTFCAGGAACVGEVSASNSLVGTTPTIGASTGDQIGLNVTLIPTGGYVATSPYWNNGISGKLYGAAVPCPATGCTGEVDTSNSLYGTHDYDQVAGSVTPLANGDFVVGSMSWENGLTQDGAATYCASVTDPNCIGQAVSTSNSLTASLHNAIVSGGGVTALTDGSYVVNSSSWKINDSTSVGAATFCEVSGGASSCTGQVISPSNSLTGDTNGDSVGSTSIALPGGAYVVMSSQWHNWTGAVTYCSSGSACQDVIVSYTNSLVGSAPGDGVGNAGLIPLSTGGYLVLSRDWKKGSVTKAGAVTYCPPTGCTGSVTAANSLTGANTDDQVGMGGGFELAGGAFVISSPMWNNGAHPEAGAVTYCSSAAACMGDTVKLENSLVSDQDNNRMGYYENVKLSNGAYLVGSSSWMYEDQEKAGALTWCPSTGCTNMVISTANSLHGTHAWDYVTGGLEVGDNFYIVPDSGWQNGPLVSAGAVTLCTTTGGCSGPITENNSVLGDVAGQDLDGWGAYSYHSYDYDALNHNLVVGKPFENQVVFFTLDRFTDVSLSASASSTVQGQNVTFTATAAPNQGTGTPTGTVTFYNGSTVLCSSASLTAGTAVCSTTALAVGEHTHIRAVYSGDSTFHGGTSLDLTHTVTEAPAECTAVGSGTVNWSDAFTACPPGAKLIIPPSLTVILNVDANLGVDLEVQGSLDAISQQKTLTLTGSDSQTLTGNPLTFYRLTLNKTNNTDEVSIVGKLRVTRKLTIAKGKLISASDYMDIEIGEDGSLALTGDITVGGNFYKAMNGDFIHNNHKVTFDGGIEQNLTLLSWTDFYDLVVSAGTTLIETETDDNATVSSSLTNDGVIRKTQPVTGDAQYYFGLAGSYNGDDLEIDVTTQGTLSAVQVERTDVDHDHKIAGAVGEDLYWSITPTGSGYTASVTLPHAAGAPADTRACRYLMSGAQWSCRRDAYTATSVTYSGATAFSDWSVGLGLPSALTDAASSLTGSGATLNGTVISGSSDATVTFEYGATSAYGSTVTAEQSPVVSSSDPMAVRKAVTGLAPNTTYHYRVVAASASGDSYGADHTFTTSTVAPTVSTGSAASLTSSGATLNGTVNANNASSAVTFEYGLTAAYGSTVTADQSPVTGSTGSAVSKAITGLEPNTTYHFRVSATSSGGTSHGLDQTFTTHAVAPSVTTGSAGSITTGGATLNGTVNANNASTTVTFEYGTTTSYGSTVTADQSPATGTGSTTVSKIISGLEPNTSYHFRVSATSSGGTSHGLDQTFKTSAAAPSATTTAATSVTNTGATLNGTVIAYNASTSVTFEYGATTAYGSTVTAEQSPVSGTSSIPTSKVITGLAPNTTYHYRVVAVNAGGTAYGLDQSFTTPAETFYSLTVLTGGTGGGKVQVSPDETSFKEGSTVTLTATANPGSVFAGWVGSALGAANPLSVTIDADKTITATFTSLGEPNPPDFDDPPESVPTPGEDFYLEITVNDPDLGDAITITVVDIPDWMTFTSTGNGAGYLSGKVPRVPTRYTIELEARDSAGNKATLSYNFQAKWRLFMPLFFEGEA